jgi:hypothetical protein
VRVRIAPAARKTCCLAPLMNKMLELFPPLFCRLTAITQDVPFRKVRSPELLLNSLIRVEDKKFRARRYPHGKLQRLSGLVGEIRRH